MEKKPDLEAADGEDSTKGSEEEVPHAQLQGCPSESVRPLSLSQIPCNDVALLLHVVCYFFNKSMAGQADVCKGCPGRELCLRQGTKASSPHAVNPLV